MHRIVSANIISKYTIKTFVFWYQFGRTTFPHKYGKKTKKLDYKCGLSLSILLKFAFNISMKVREINFEPKNAHLRACLDQIIVKAQMTPGSESATYSSLKTSCL